MASYGVIHAAKNPKLAHAGANLAKSSILVPKVISRSIETEGGPTARDSSLPGANSQSNESISNPAASPTPMDNVTPASNYSTGPSSATEDLTGRAKQKLQDAWNNARDTVVDKTRETKESLKETASEVEDSMNSKNDV
ncbi:hypothetical protein EUGRSUZ_H01376 [Eucalyptus grandis]|uniref:Uncharacterized protein n=2 Tax=Eucalyptus grandis TaxID=71139 RepID=A0ACC3JPN5_EUCGR|nr:hypothetical protein EUGRSUZ_H01376 [Eucalyptus grandis]